MKFLNQKIVLVCMAVGAVAGPLVVLRDALFSSETDWSGNWWIVAALTAAAVGSVLGAAVGAGTSAVLKRVQPQPGF